MLALVFTTKTVYAGIQDQLSLKKIYERPLEKLYPLTDPNQAAFFQSLELATKDAGLEAPVQTVLCFSIDFINQHFILRQQIIDHFKAYDKFDVIKNEITPHAFVNGFDDFPSSNNNYMVLEGLDDHLHIYKRFSAEGEEAFHYDTLEIPTKNDPKKELYLRVLAKLKQTGALLSTAQKELIKAQIDEEKTSALKLNVEIEGHEKTIQLDINPAPQQKFSQEWLDQLALHLTPDALAKFEIDKVLALGDLWQNTSLSQALEKILTASKVNYRIGASSYKSQILKGCFKGMNLPSKAEEEPSTKDNDALTEANDENPSYNKLDKVRQNRQLLYSLKKEMPVQSVIDNSEILLITQAETERGSIKALRCISNEQLKRSYWRLKFNALYEQEKNYYNGLIDITETEWGEYYSWPLKSGMFLKDYVLSNGIQKKDHFKALDSKDLSIILGIINAVNGLKFADKNLNASNFMVIENGAWRDSMSKRVQLVGLNPPEGNRDEMNEAIYRMLDKLLSPGLFQEIRLKLNLDVQNG